MDLCRSQYGLDSCDGTCVDLQTDELNGGTCRGYCNADWGETCCGGACVHLLQDPGNCGSAGMSARQDSGATTGRVLQVPATRGCPIAVIFPVLIRVPTRTTAVPAGMPALQPMTVSVAPAGPALRGANGALTGARTQCQTHMPAAGAAMCARQMSSAKTAGVFPVCPGRAGVYG